MADNINEKKEELNEAAKIEQEELKDAYEDIRKRLRTEGERLQNELQREYTNARKYVEKNPETGLGVALAGGMLLGLVVAKLFSSK